MANDGKFKDLSILVTGASSGIGIGVARRLAQEGAAVAINYRSHKEPAEELVAEILGMDGRAIALGGHVSKEDDVCSLSEETVTAFGRLDVLVANSGG